MTLVPFLTSIAAGVLALMPIVDPIAAAPMFIALTAGDTAARRRQQAHHAVLYMTAILLAFFAMGLGVLEFFSISMEGLRIAGGVMILHAGRAMLQTEPRVGEAEQVLALAKTDISLTPLAMPLLSGPGAIAVVISLATQARAATDRVAYVLAVLIVAAATWLVLRGAIRLQARLGASTIAAVTRLMGFLTLCVGVQFVINGVRPLLLATLTAAINNR